ncbi:Transcription initiation factor TFIID, subunit TAF1 [Trachipleistophora hominis]|uniref:Transcription initiation factor TFIID, subunit TAF1 n=1 Tax=Trachipleistophora hominis TaxID=72359 RepID=L7JUB6_TRAHO|nr:Transcription initiation factor TFIID, subunit TAF1 [Trachipleistophora hominis]
MHDDNYRPLDILTTPRPLTYRLHKYKVRRSAQQKLQFESDYTKKPTDTPSVNSVSNRAHNLIVRRHLRKKRFDREVLARWRAERAAGDYIVDDGCDQPINFVDWESRVIYDDRKVPASEHGDESEAESIGAFEEDERAPPPIKTPDIKTIELIRSIFNNEYWESQIIYDESNLNNFKTYVTINVNDPNLILERIDKRKVKKTKTDARRSNYNISNDRYYETLSVKSNLGNLGMQHSLPALRLDMGLFKTFLTKEELRNFHRPALSLLERAEKAIFSRTLPKSSQQSIKSPSQLTLTDSASFALFEYSEEIPLLVQNRGMVSLLTTYYKNNGNTPKKYLGKLTVLESEEPSPFIVDIKPGTCLTALTNNLFKACVFKHAVTDYLMIVTDSPVGEGTDDWKDESEEEIDAEEVARRNVVGHSGKMRHADDDRGRDHARKSAGTKNASREGNKQGVGKTVKPLKYFLRKINAAFTVGQTFPVEEVYSPHSRKLNIFCKNRLKVAAFREYQNNGLLSASYIEDLFPQFSEGSKRKWLKEYSDSFKRGKETFYQLKKSATVLNEEDLRGLVTPENVCQYEAMLCAEQRLRDCGLEYKENVMEEGELLLMPWNLSRNFINYVGGRGILEMKGPGDPTGIGEGFSFVKGNVKAADPEVIWEREQRSLSSARDILYDEVKGLIEERENRKSVEPVKPVVANTSSYVLITRVIDDEEHIEKITDPLVIKAYLKQRKKVRSEERKGTPKNVLRCGACGLVGHMKTNKSCPNFCARTLKGTSTPKKAKNLLTDLINKTIQRCAAMNYASAFLRPVSAKKFPDYLKVVTDPIDLGTMKSKSKNHKYANFGEFVSDLRKMWQNCVAYNGVDHGLSKLAKNMLELGEETMKSKKDEIIEIQNVMTKGEDEAA